MSHGKPKPPLEGRPRTRAPGGLQSGPPGRRACLRAWPGVSVRALRAVASRHSPSPLVWMRDVGVQAGSRVCFRTRARSRDVGPRHPPSARTRLVASPGCTALAADTPGVPRGCGGRDWDPGRRGCSTRTCGVGRGRSPPKAGAVGGSPGLPRQGRVSAPTRGRLLASALGWGLPRKCNNIYDQREMRKCSPSTRSTSHP